MDRKASNQWAFFNPSTRRNKGLFGKAGRAENRTLFCENDTHTNRLREAVKSEKNEKVKK
jgi:hypothetical protein